MGWGITPTIRCESSQAKSACFSYPNSLPTAFHTKKGKDLTTFVLITSMEAKFVLAARARVAEHARTGTNSQYTADRECVQTPSNLTVQDGVRTAAVGSYQLA